MAKITCPTCIAKTEHMCLEEKGEYNEIYKVSCSQCNGEREIHRKEWFAYVKDDVRNGPAYRTKYPFEDSVTGAVVNSRDDQREKAARLGFTEQRHQLDVKKSEHKKIRVDRNLWGS